MKKLIFLAAASLLLVACNNNDNYLDEPVAAQISATIGNSALSRASDENWASGDEIGVSMDDRYINIKYTTDHGDGIFAGTTMYFKNKRESVTLSAYYPYAGNEGSAAGIIETNTKANRQTADEQPKFDFLYDQKAGVVGTDPNVSFNFSHKMGKITLIFKNGNEGTDVSKITSYQIDGLILDGTFNTATGVCAAKGESQAESLTMTLNEGVAQHEQPVPSLILFPQSTAGKTVRLKISDSEGQDYACTLTFEDNKIESGNNYLFKITVNKTGLTVNKSTITDWNTKDSSDNNADAIDPE